MASIGVAVPAFAEFEIENIGAQMTGLDPMFIIGGSLMGVGAVGWLLGPFLGTTFFNIWKGSVRKEFARVCMP
jgi:import inner membrane translocase subunit TIM23